MSPTDNRPSVRPVLGLLITAFGVALALDALELLEADRILSFWPLILVTLGLFLLLRARSGGPWFPGAVLLLLGSALVLEELGYLHRGLDAIWPLIIILLGLAIMSRGFKPRRTDRARTSVDSVSSFAVLCSNNPTSSSQAFRGGDVSAFMGGLEVDLTAADIAAEEAVLDVFVLMGGIEIRVPRDWTVDSRVTPFMGGMEDSTDRSASDPAKHLVIKGFVMMGGVEIKN